MKFIFSMPSKGSRIVLVGGALAAVLFLTSCRESKDTASAGHDHGAALVGADSGKDAAEDLYQCSMHPNIVSEKPGTCPICAMDLQPVKKIDAKGIPGRAPVELTDQQQQLINIRLIPVVKQPASKTIRTVGIVAYDQTQVADVNARIMGWVETLYVDKPGQPVEKGERLMALYSPDLYSAQQEYLLAYQSAQNLQTNAPLQSEQLRRFSAMNRTNTLSLLSSARKRLELWGIGSEQVRALERSGQASNTMALNSPITGVVVDKNVFPQQMIQPGTRLYRIADLSRIWVEPEIYEYEVPLVDVGQKAMVHVPAYPGITFEGEVDFIYPYVDPKTRTVRIRLVLENPRNQLKPGMYANAIIESSLGEQVLVPESAVFDTGRRSYVFTQGEPGVFVPKLVQLGPQVGDYRVVQSGLQPGEKVVVNGNFLLDSESQLKAAAVGSRESDAIPAEHETTTVPLPASAAPFFSGILTNYLALGKTLAKDEFEELGPFVTSLAERVEALREGKIVPSQDAARFTNLVAQLAREAGEFEFSSLESARVQYGEVSQALISLVAHFTPPLKENLYIAECPMWKKSPPRWIQVTEDLENPYMGQKMLKCGEIVRTIQPALEPAPLPSAAAPVVRDILSTYQSMYEPLTRDSLEGVDAAAASLNELVLRLRDSALAPAEAGEEFEKQLDILAECITAFEPGGDLELARKHFGEVSSALVELFKRYPPPLDQAWPVFYCPMWNKSRAFWIQPEAPARNPFMGQEMLQCGEIVGVLEPVTAVPTLEGAQP